MTEQTQNFVYSAFKPNSMGASSFPTRRQPPPVQCAEEQEQRRPVMRAPTVPCYQNAMQPTPMTAALYGDGSGGLPWLLIGGVVVVLIVIIIIIVMVMKHKKDAGGMPPGYPQ